jgi:type I restriction enzyme S subunit
MELNWNLKQTHVGPLPEDWSLVTVRELVDQGILDKPLDGNHGNIHPKSNEYESYGIPFVMQTTSPMDKLIY